LTQDERLPFKEMDSAAAAHPSDANPALFHQVVSRIGAIDRLSLRQSGAFWTRTTFMLFEPESLS
jgi:hypothetical protein